jgi:hypothetical protein
MTRRLLVLLAALLPGLAAAHEIRPMLLDLAEGGNGQVQVTLKLPVYASGEMAAVNTEFPAGCRASGPVQNSPGASALLSRWTMRCPQGLAGSRLKLSGFSALTPDGLVMVHFADGRDTHYAVNRDHADLRLEPAEAGARVEKSLLAFVPIGIGHIWGGPDHLMFVLGLMLVVWRTRAGLRSLIGTVTAFTLAHSLTLALSVLWGITLPAAPVETLIALSILLLAVELARTARQPAARLDTLTFRRPWLVAFVFGLLHGFGFAGALMETGLPEQARATALLLFNLGVEAGQLQFIAVAALCALLLRRLPLLEMPRLAGAATSVIGCVSAAWVLQRSAAIFLT